MIKASLKRASRLQRVIEAGLVIIALIVTAWCVVNNVEPTIDWKSETEQNLDHATRRHEHAVEQNKLFNEIYFFCSTQRQTYAHDDRDCVGRSYPFEQITDTAVRALLTTRLALQDAHVADNRRIEKSGCGSEYVRFDDTRYPRKCFGEHDRHADTHHPALKAVGDVLSKALTRYARASERLRQLREEAQRDYEYAHWEELEAKKRADTEFEEHLAAEKKEQEELAKADAAFEAKLLKAGAGNTLSVVLMETVKRTATLWAWIAGLCLLIILALRMGPTEDIPVGDETRIRIPILPFGRPRFACGSLSGWKLVVDFRGRTLLEDEDGARVRIYRWPHVYAFEVFHGKSVAEFMTGSKRIHTKMNELSALVNKARRLLILTVESLRKSRDFQRSQVIGAVRRSILERVKAGFPYDDPIHAELRLREEEEKLSERIGDN